MPEVTRWVCTTDPSHVFDEDTEDHFCPLDPPYHGFLVKQPGPPPEEVQVTITAPNDGQLFEGSNNILFSADASTDSGSITKVEFFADENKIGEAAAPPYSCTYFNPPGGVHALAAKAWSSEGKDKTHTINVTVKSSGPEVGLCVILMDASSSMTDPAFQGSPLTRMRLVATNAASGIFDLERMQNNPNAFVAAFKFDDRVELMFVDTISNLLKRYENDVRKFANYIYEELAKMQQGTDINKALQYAYDFVAKFLKRELPGLPIRNYTPMKQRILKHDSVESVSIPNIRVLIYTDGMQYDAEGNRTLHPNPFKENPLPGLGHDILIGAFFGQESDEGCKQLKSLLSNCPIHDIPQFFLFDHPAQMTNLKYLFRMASGASGFCPKCLEKQLTR